MFAANQGVDAFGNPISSEGVHNAAGIGHGLVYNSELSRQNSKDGSPLDERRGDC